MSKRFYLSSFILLTILLLMGCGPEGVEIGEAPNGPFVIQNGTVITGTGADPIPNGAVVVVDGLITAVGPRTEIEVPDGTAVIDAEGGTILPGLIDARASDLLSRLKNSDGEIGSTQVDVLLKRTLEFNGITTVRATGWSWEEMQELPELSKALEEFGKTIPTIVYSGSSVTHVDGPAYTLFYKDQTVGVGTVEESVQITQAIIDLGADQVNIMMSSGPSLSALPEDREPLLTLEMLTQIVETAHDQDKKVIAQALFPEEAMTVLEAGVDELSAWPFLAEPMSEEVLQAIVSRNIPVLSGFIVGQPLEGDVRRFLDAGGILVFGTFAPNSRARPVSEFQTMEKHGMTPMEMIQSATLNAANALGLGDVVGSLEVGKQADIIVVGAGLLEDIRVIREMVYVIKGGQVVVVPEKE